MPDLSPADELRAAAERLRSDPDAPRYALELASWLSEIASLAPQAQHLLTGPRPLALARAVNTPTEET